MFSIIYYCFYNVAIFSFIAQCTFSVRNTFFAVISVSSKGTYDLLPIHKRKFKTWRLVFVPLCIMKAKKIRVCCGRSIVKWSYVKQTVTVSSSVAAQKLIFLASVRRSLKMHTIKHPTMTSLPVWDDVTTVKPWYWASQRRCRREGRSSEEARWNWATSTWHQTHLERCRRHCWS